MAGPRSAGSTNERTVAKTNDGSEADEELKALKQRAAAYWNDPEIKKALIESAARKKSETNRWRIPLKDRYKTFY